jgi:hypothetical protein
MYFCHKASSLSLAALDITKSFNRKTRTINNIPNNTGTQHLRDIPDLMYSMDVLIIFLLQVRRLPIINFIKTPTPMHACDQS